MTAPRVPTRDVVAGTAPYRVLHYSGDVTASVEPGSILGHDDFGRPFEVLDAEVEQVLADGHTDGDGCELQTFGDTGLETVVLPGHRRARTAVHLQYATVETLRAATAQLVGA